MDELKQILITHSFWRMQNGFQIVSKCDCGYKVTSPNERERRVNEAEHVAHYLKQTVKLMLNKEHGKYADPDIIEAEIVDE